MSASVFVDTSAFFALTDRRDDNHAAAAQAAQQLAQENTDIYTTNFIIAETHALTLNRLGRDMAALVLDQLYAGAARIIRVAEDDEQRARAIIAQYRDKAFSLTDATSFAVMERLGIRLAWTYDLITSSSLA